MDSIKKMIECCEDFQKGQYSIAEFQQRLHSFSMNDLSNNLYEFIDTLDNQLEELRFCYAENDQLSVSIPIVLGFREILIIYASKS